MLTALGPRKLVGHGQGEPGDWGLGRVPRPCPRSLRVSRTRSRHAVSA